MRNYTFLLGIVSDNIASILRLLRGDSIGARHRRTQDERKRLQQHIKLICWILEGHHIMRMARDALGISTGGKHVLTQVDNGAILTMRIFGEQVKDAFVSAPFIHESIHDQKSSSSSKSVWLLGRKVDARTTFKLFPRLVLIQKQLENNRCHFPRLVQNIRQCASRAPST